MKKKLVLTFLLLAGILSNQSIAQKGISLNDFQYNVGLYGDNVIHPGLKLGSSYILKTKEKTKVRKFKGLENKWGSKLKTIQYTADLNLGFYNHPNNNLGTFIGVGASRIRTKARKNRVLGFSFEINYLRKFYNIPSYRLNENNEIERVRLSGTNELMLVFTPTFGKNILMDKDFGGMRIYAKPSVQVVTYNQGIVPNFAFELGCTLNLKK